MFSRVFLMQKSFRRPQQNNTNEDRIQSLEGTPQQGKRGKPRTFEVYLRAIWGGLVFSALVDNPKVKDCIETMIHIFL